MSVNRVFLVGNLGKDAEVRTPDGVERSVISFTLATTEYRRTQSGETREETTWHNIVYWVKAGSRICEYLVKGASVLVEGSIRNRKYEDRSGNTKYITEIVATNVQFVGQKPQQESSKYGQQAQYQPSGMPTGGYQAPQYGQPQNNPQGFQQTGLFPNQPVNNQAPVRPPMPAGFEDLPDGF